MTRTILTSCLVVAMGLALPVVLAEKQAPPEGGTPKDFKLPQKAVFKLDNGFSATLVPYGMLPKVAISVYVRSGNVNESANQVWLADVTGDLLKEGTKSRTAQKVAEEIAGMGGTIAVTVGPDQTTISTDVLSEFAPRAIELLSDVCRNPLLPESELKRIKNDRLRQLSITKTTPDSITLERFRQLLYPGHPYGRLFPTTEMLEGYTIQDVRDFYAKNFGAVRARVYVCGQFERSAVEQAIRKSFEGWDKGSDPVQNVPATTAKRQFEVIDRPGSEQSTVYLGLPVIAPGSRDYIPLVVTNSLLGGSFGSRITSNIREQKGYTYSPYSSVSSRYRDAYWAQFASISTNVTAPALTEIFHEIDRLQAEPPSVEELKGIQNYLAGTFVLQNSSRTGIISQLAFLALHGLPDDYLTGYVKAVHSVKPEDVRRIAQTYLRDQDMTLVVTGDKSKMDTQVGEFVKKWEKGSD
ncbi:MAG: insulinase family protein [Acidobacteria bacterium]|nr:MAG: insulinase family protein [Acidobacteriota bacterium]